MSARPSGSAGGGTPAGEEFSRSSPGTEAFKQDRGSWESLRRDVDLALDRYEASVAGRLTRKAREDRLSAGASERGPEEYRQRVSRYFESIAAADKVRKP
jgi:hypothetical protein